jgi:hypothetical protein
MELAMKAKKLATLCLGAAVGGLLTLNAAAQTVYRVIDEDGNVAYTDRPPSAQEAGDRPVETMRLQIKLTDPATVAANREQARDTAEADAIAGGIRDAQAAEDQAEQARREQQRAANCDVAKQRFKKYSEARRLYRDLGEGEREYLSSDEIDSERVSAARAVDEWCGN